MGDLEYQKDFDNQTEIIDHEIVFILQKSFLAFRKNATIRITDLVWIWISTI